MSIANLNSTLRHLQQEVSAKELSFTPIIISDSKGNYLKRECESLSNKTINQIIWWNKSGAKILETKNWITRNFRRLTRQYNRVVVFLWLGTCDLTSKNKDGQISLRKQDDNSQAEFIAEIYREIVDYLKSSRCKVIILETPYYSIHRWNTKNGENAHFEAEDKRLKRQVVALNELTAEINRSNNITAPKLNIDLQRPRKKRGCQQYHTNWLLLKDGVHPTQIVAKVWLLKIAKQCLREN